MTNLENQLNEVKRIRELSKRKKNKRSRLDKFRTELVELRLLGASWKDLQVWLQTFKRIKMSISGIRSALTKWIESPDYIPIETDKNDT